MTRGDIFNPKKKNFWLLMGAAVLGIVLMLLGGTGNSKTAEPGTGQRVAGDVVEKVLPPSGNNMMTAEEKEIAAELKRMLEKIAGVGRVDVTVRLASSTYNEYAINTDTGLKTTEESDHNGGTRKITENTDSSTLVITGSGQGQEKPVIKRELAPEVAGVLVVAEGANSPHIKANLFRAVQVALGVQPHKIIVMTMRGETSD